MATLGFFSAVFVMPLAEATAISFTSPMLTAVLAPLLLREKLQRSSIAALIVAFGGVLVILRPSLADLGLAALLPLMAALGMSLLMIGNRAVAGSGSSLAMQATVATLAVPVLAAATVAGHLSGLPELHVSVPDRSVVARCALVAVTASFAHWLVFLGTERASAARVAPMTYVQLLTAQSLGWALFSEPPDGLTLVGAAIIVSAGLWLWWSGRVKEPVPTE
jgi:drug/metabolite transporter (DMT)-like permease